MGGTMTYTYLGDGTKVAAVVNLSAPASTPTDNAILEQNCYTPFGTRLQSTDLKTQAANRWRYNYFSMSPYSYCGNDPVNMVDPEGKELIFSHWVSDGNGNGTWEEGVSQQLMTALEAFASTNEGYTFLAKFAKAGQSIGDILFLSDGDLKKYATIFRCHTVPEQKRMVEKVDHDAYFNGRRPQFNSYMKQLSSFFSPREVNRAKNSHDIGIKD